MKNDEYNGCNDAISAALADEDLRWRRRHVVRPALYVMAGLLGCALLVAPTAHWPEWTWLTTTAVIGFCIGRGSGYAR